jgi:hypothetical protein
MGNIFVELVHHLRVYGFDGALVDVEGALVKSFEE